MTSDSALAFALGQYNITPKIRIDGKEYTLRQIEAIVRAYYKLEGIVRSDTKGKDEISSNERVETISSKDTSKTTKQRRPNTKTPIQKG